MSPLPSISLRSAARLPLSAALALAMLALPAVAHPRAAGCGMGAGAQAPTINVQGEGRASVAPDLATVSLGVTTQAPTAAQAMSDNATRQTAIIEALRAQGLAPADLQTQGLSLSPLQDYSREGQPPVITGYQAQNIVTARVRDLTRLGPMLDAMVAAGATDVQGISFSREDAAETEDRARTEAVAEARRRAEVIARAAGMELGPLVSLTDTSMTQGPPADGHDGARRRHRGLDPRRGGRADPERAGDGRLVPAADGWGKHGLRITRRPSRRTRPPPRNADAWA